MLVLRHGLRVGWVEGGWRLRASLELDAETCSPPQARLQPNPDTRHGQPNPTFALSDSPKVTKRTFHAHDTLC